MMFRISCCAKGASFVLTLLVVVFCQQAQGQEKVGAPFLEITNSARANGMGGCTVTLADAESAPYNPAGLGLFHLDKCLSITVPNNTRWLPELRDDLRIKSWGASAGASLNRLSPTRKAASNYAIAFAYNRLELDYGEFVETTYEYPLGGRTFHPVDKTDIFSVAVGLAPHPATRLGIGLSLKKINSDFGLEEDQPAKGTAYDLGFIFELKLAEFFPMTIANGESQKHEIGFEVTPAYGFVEANMGDDLDYGDLSVRLPKRIHRGPSLYLAINVDKARLFSGRLAGETEKDLTHSVDNKSYRNGYEFGLFDILFYRAGRLSDPSGHSYGFGVSTAGIGQWVKKLTTADEHKSALVWVLNHVELRYDFAMYDWGDMGDIKFLRLTASL